MESIILFCQSSIGLNLYLGFMKCERCILTLYFQIQHPIKMDYCKNIIWFLKNVYDIYNIYEIHKIICTFLKTWYFWNLA